MEALEKIHGTKPKSPLESTTLPLTEALDGLGPNVRQDELTARGGASEDVHVAWCSSGQGPSGNRESIDFRMRIMRIGAKNGLFFTNAPEQLAESKGTLDNSNDERTQERTRAFAFDDLKCGDGSRSLP
jgi:hypothetical protein